MNAVVAFLEERGQDGSGRFVSDVLNFGLGALESQPAYIPWFFPLIQPSADARSPGLDQTDVDQIRASERARGNLLKAAQRMAWFYDQTDHWLAASDHNHGRITRIIKSLRLLVSDSVANGFSRRNTGQSRSATIQSWS